MLAEENEEGDGAQGRRDQFYAATTRFATV